MKIIIVDNFDRESSSDTLVAENINKYWGEKVVDFLNNKFSGDDSPSYFKLVEDGHKLYIFEPYT
jgi:hypothetical protein